MRSGSIKNRLKATVRSISVSVKKITNRVWEAIEPTWPAFLVSLVLLIGLLVLKDDYEKLAPVQQGVYVEAWGSVVDILLVGVVLTLFSRGLTRKREISRHREQIDDFKKWDDVEGRLRIAGSIRRLAKLGVTKIDLRGIILRNFSFEQHDIINLKGSVFNDGIWLSRASRNHTLLENVDFGHVDCRNVVFSAHVIGGMKGIDLRFFSANLNGANFEGATLVWTSTIPSEEDWWEKDYDGDGEPIYFRKHSPAFEGANLKNCSFKNTTFKSADFREAENLLEADFSGAKGLEGCFFDEGLKEKVLLSAASKAAAS